MTTDSETLKTFEDWQDAALRLLKTEFNETLSGLFDNEMKTRATTALSNYAKAYWAYLRAEDESVKIQAQTDLDHCASALKAYECIVELKTASLFVRVLGNLLGQFVKSAIKAAIWSLSTI